MNQTKSHFDKVARGYDYGKHKYSYYYENLKKLLGSIIPKNSRVYEVGCGTGDLLASLNPKIGIGYDISPKMISIAKSKYKDRKNLFFTHNTQFTVHCSLDYIFMSDVIEHLENPKETFSKISKLMNKDSLFVITMANPIWEPLLMLWEKLGLKMKEGPHNRISANDLKLIIKDSKLRVVKHDYKLLIPIQIPFLTVFINKYLEKYFKKFAFIEYFTAVKK